WRRWFITSSDRVLRMRSVEIGFYGKLKLGLWSQLMRHWGFRSTGFIVVWGVLGCGPAAPKYPDLAPFTGTVKLDGAPMKDAEVTFSPVPSWKEGLAARAFTNDAGTFELQTSIGRTHKPGAMPGNYRVTIRRMAMPMDPKSPPTVP